MISASIVLYNTKEEDIRRVINCANNASLETIYVIDNSPSNKLRELCISLSEKLEYIWSNKNVGYGKAHNIALSKAIDAGFRYHVILNPDISFERGTIENIASFMDGHQDVGYVLPNVVYPDGNEQYLCKMLPTPFDIFGRRLFPESITQKRNYKFEMRATGYDKIRNVPILSGCFMFLRIDVIKKVGMFDNRFFMYFEDFDLIRRIHQVSKTVFYPKVQIVHNHAAEHRTSKKLLKISIQSAIHYFNKWGWLIDKERTRINRCAFDDDNIIV
jgi:GT2 family glycosyltransferase